MDDRKILNMTIASLFLLFIFLVCTLPYVRHLNDRHKEHIRQEQIAQAQEQRQALEQQRETGDIHEDEFAEQLTKLNKTIDQ
ncbi:hypothetical protein [Paraburkholderia aromaticivorans]|uniref:hypothetical protein n=1 Tax=Paraburkholderia aromaticivorans TaxID=2026199 RepID=UPI0038BBB52C